MKLNNRTKLIVSVLLTLLMLISASVAWFFTNNDVEVNHGSTIQCEAGNSLEISLDGGATWHGRVDYTDVSPKIVDISGNGLKLYRPKVITETGEPQSFVVASPVDENGEGDYIEFDIMFRSASKMNIYLSGESAVTPGSTSTEKSNIYGNFSTDYIAGAVRVAVIQEVEGTEQLKMIWAPNPYYQLKKTNGIYDFTATGNRESSYSYYYAANDDLTDMKIHTINSDQYADRQFVFGSTKSDITKAGSSPILATLDTMEADSNFYTTSLTVRVWFEGTDREADQALSGGWADMLFKFNGVQKLEAEAAKQQAIDDLALFSGTLIGLAEGMQYSTNGYDWITYNGQNAPTFVSGTVWYFKYPETDTNFETTYKKIIVE